MEAWADTCPIWSLNPFLILGFILHCFLQQSSIRKCAPCRWDAMENPHTEKRLRSDGHVLKSSPSFKQYGGVSLEGRSVRCRGVWEDRIIMDRPSWGVVVGEASEEGVWRRCQGEDMEHEQVSEWMTLCTLTNLMNDRTQANVEETSWKYPVWKFRISSNFGCNLSCLIHHSHGNNFTYHILHRGKCYVG